MTIDASALTFSGGFLTIASVTTTVAGGPQPTYEVCNHPADICKAGSGVSNPSASSPGPNAGQYSAGTTARGYRIDVSKPDGNPATGSVYLANTGSRRIERFSLDGTSPTNFGTTTEFASGNPSQVAVGADGMVYASHLSGTNSITRFDPSLPGFITPVDVATLSETSSAPSVTANGLEIDGSTGNLIVARFSNTYGPIEISTPGATPALVEIHPSVGGSPDHIGVNGTNGNLYFSTTSQANRLYLLDSDGAPPATVTPKPATAVGADGATLHATVDDNGVLKTTYRFEYSRNGSDWTTAPGGATTAGGAVTDVDSPPITGLLPNTFYRFRVVTLKEGSPFEANSAELVFLTDAIKPSINNTSADTITNTTTRLTAQVNPHSTQTSYRFEWGTHPASLTNHTPIPDAPIGSGAGYRFVEQQLSGLAPNTTHHYRIAATSTTEGTSFGSVKTFTTLATAPIADSRAYELVTPADKATGPGVGSHAGNDHHDGDLSATKSGLPSRNGERFVSSTGAGPVLVPGAAVMTNDVVFSERTPAGWRSRSAFTRANYRPLAEPPNLKPIEFSDDFRTGFWLTGPGASLFPEMTPDFDSINLNLLNYVSDWSGRWHLAAPTDPQGSNPQLASNAVSADGAAVAFTSSRANGLTGSYGADSGDPAFDQIAGRSAYYMDASDGLSDTFADRGGDALLGACTEGTVVPQRLSSGKLAEQSCPPPVEFAPGRFRDAGLVSLRGSSLTAGGVSVSATRRIVSDAGLRTFFMAPDPEAGDPDGAGPLSSDGAACSPATGAATSCPPQLYVRVQTDAGPVVRWISKPTVPDQDATLLGPAYFAGASADGDRVFFHTTTPLTPDDPNTGGTCSAPCTVGNASPTSWDLYVYDFTDDPAAGALTRVSRGPTGAADANVVINARAKPSSPLRFVSDDGRRAYFTTAAPLVGASGRPEGALDAAAGTTTTSDFVNLYLYDVTAGEHWTFVARLPAASPGIALGPQAQGDIRQCATTAAVEANPRYALQSSDNARGVMLLAGTNCVRGSADGTAVSFWTLGRLTADDPDAASGDVYLFDAQGGELVRISAPQGGAGGSYTCMTAGDVQCHGDPGFSAAHTSLQEATLGFATDPVTGGGPVAFFESRDRLTPDDTDEHMDVYQWQDGRLALVTVGVDAASAHYAGNSADGRSVFFGTRQALTWQDIDAVPDTYVARVGGGIPQPPAPAGCEVLAGGCQGAGAAPLPVQPKTTSSAGSPTGDNASPGVRKRLRVGNISRKARTRAARRGVLRVRVRTSRAGLVQVLARAKIGKRTRRVAGRKVRVREAGAVTVKLRLNRAAKRWLRRGRALRVTLRVASPGARTRTATVRLKRGRRS